MCRISGVSRAGCGGDLPDFEGARQAAAKSNFRAVVPFVEHTVSEINAFADVVPLLRERGWKLIKAPEGTQFVTGSPDFAPGGRRSREDAIGLKLKGMEVVFPISPALAMIGANESEDGKTEATAEQVASVYGASIFNFQKRVYSL